MENYRGFRLYIFDNNNQKLVKQISVSLINHPLTDTNSDAKIIFILNNVTISNSSTLKINERKLIDIPLVNIQLKEKNNILNLIVPSKKMYQRG